MGPWSFKARAREEQQQHTGLNLLSAACEKHHIIIIYSHSTGFSSVSTLFTPKWKISTANNYFINGKFMVS